MTDEDYGRAVARACMAELSELEKAAVGPIQFGSPASAPTPQAAPAPTGAGQGAAFRKLTGGITNPLTTGTAPVQSGGASAFRKLTRGITNPLTVGGTP